MTWQQHANSIATPDDILCGVRVLDLCQALAGPYTSMMLAELGADVIKVEHRVGGDETRAWPPIAHGMGGYFATINRSKRSIGIDLKQAAGLEVVLDLAREADVVMESFTPGVADRLGVGYESVRALNEDVVYFSLSGFGQGGPWRTRRGYDPILQAASGHMSVMGEQGRQPVKSMVPIADVGTAVHSLSAILAALFRHSRTGLGARIDMSMLDVMVSMLNVVATRYLQTGVVPERQGAENPQRVPSSAFECADGRLLQLVPNQRQWPDFCDLIGHPDWASDPRFATPMARVDNQSVLYPLLREAMKAKPAAEWEEALVERTIACSAINNLAEVFDLEQVKFRGLVEEYALPNGAQLPGLRLPFRFGDAAARIRSGPPSLGEHTLEVLREMGRSDGEIHALLGCGAVGGDGLEVGVAP